MYMVEGNILKNSKFMKMNNYLSDVMVDKFKILILYVIKDIGIIDIRKIILEKIFGKDYITRINYIPHPSTYSYKYLHTKPTHQS